LQAGLVISADFDVELVDLLFVPQCVPEKILPLVVIVAVTKAL